MNTADIAGSPVETLRQLVPMAHVEDMERSIKFYGQLGFKVSILPDACSSVDDELERLALRYAEEVVGARLHAVDEVGRGAPATE